MPRESWAALPPVFVGLLLGALMIMGTRDFALDDAWIHLDYAMSLRGGGGFSYNPGDHETGFSSPLWVLLLAVWPIAGDPVVPVKLLGTLLHGASAWFGALVTLELARNRADEHHPLPLAAMTLLGGTLVACAPTSVHAATSGMEVPLATALALATLREVLRGHVRAAAVLGMLCTWARPELVITATLSFIVILVGGWSRRKSSATVRAAAASCASALVGLGLWVLYCLVVSGRPWPNAQYIKGRGGGLEGLLYLRDEVLPWQPWIVGLSGALLLVVALWLDARERRSTAFAIVTAGLLTWVAIAVSRPLHPGVQFFESRYFAIVSPLPLVVVPLALRVAVQGPAWRRWLLAAAFLPLALVYGLQIRQLRAALYEQTEDTHALHTQPARYVAENLGPQAVVAVEGAGASRFFSPRSMTIVDLVGLNDQEAAAAHFDRAAKLCVFIRRRPTHLLIPSAWAPQFSPPFAVRPLQRFEDPRFTQVLPAHPSDVVLFEVGGVADDWAARCR